MTYPPSIPTKLWRPGFLYHIDAIANHRIGLERYYGIWQSRDHAPPPSRRDGRPFTNLAVLR